MNDQRPSGWIDLAWLILVGVGFVLFCVIVLSENAEAKTTATARQTDDPNTVALTVNVKVKRPLVRRIYTEACGLPSNVLFCDAREQAEKVRLRKGRNTFRLEVQRLRYQWVGVAVTGIPWDGYQMVPAPVDAVWVRLGQQGRASEVRPSPVAHDTLRDAND